MANKTSEKTKVSKGTTTKGTTTKGTTSKAKENKDKLRKLKDLNFTDGKVKEPENQKKLDYAEGSEKKRPIRSINDIWDMGETSNSLNASNADEYREMLKKMNKADLYAEGLKYHLKPRDDRNVMIRRLVDEFKKKNRDYNGIVTPKKSASISGTAEQREKVARILASGR